MYNRLYVLLPFNETKKQLNISSYHLKLYEFIYINALITT